MLNPIINPVIYPLLPIFPDAKNDVIKSIMDELEREIANENN